jgi:RAB protein geranylgeranyltransferase component A
MSCPEQAQIDRPNDIYVFCVSSSHCVAAEGKYIAFVSTVTSRSDVMNSDGTVNADVRDPKPETLNPSP